MFIGFKIIDLNKSPLQLTPSTQLNLTWTNPIFDADSVGRGYSLPFNVPGSGENLLGLEFANRLDAKNKGGKQPAKLFLLNNYIDEGVAQITGGSEENIEVVFKNKHRDVLDDLDDINIRDITGTVNVPYTGATQWTLTFTPGVGFYQLVIDDNYYQDSRDIALATIVQDMTIAINNDYPGLAFYDIFTPEQLKLNITLYDIDVPFQLLVGITLNGADTIAQDKHDSFTDFITAITATPRTDVCFPMMWVPNFYGGQNPAFQGIANYYHDGSFRINTASDDKEWEHAFIPFVRITYVLQWIIEQLGYTTLAGDLYDLTDFQQLVYYSGRALDDVTMTDFGFGDQYYNQYIQSFTIAELLPDITAREFMQKLGLLNFFIELEGNQFRIKKKATLVRKSPIDWTRKAEPAYKQQFQDKAGFKLEYEELDIEVTKDATQLQPYGDGLNVSTFPVFPLYTNVWYDTVTESLVQLLYTTAEGTSEAMGIENDPGFRLAFYRGYLADREGLLYPLGNTIDTDVLGASVGSLSLQLEGTNGIYEALWKNFIELADAPTITKTVELSVPDILEVKKWVNPVRTIYHKQGVMRGIIRDIKVIATPNDVLLSQVEFIQLL